MKLAAIATFAVLGAASLAAGCGGGSGSGSSGRSSTVPSAPAGSKVVSCTEGREEARDLRATAVDCETARTTMRHWQSSHACTLGAHGSRSACTLGDFRCQAVRIDGGAEVSCAREGADVSFVTTAWLVRKSGSG
ncbi:MAG TPA: hypothetical protein VMH33_07840 [Solirubrobacterales bacterium]|nr:hypothetical protein [Solirubrobacterales bacterium]